MNNHLLNYILDSQREYRNLLKKLIPILKKQDILPALDEIHVFWNSHLNAVDIYCSHNLILSDRDSYIFTSSTLDIDRKEHYPFLLFGNNHIFNDNLFQYIGLSKEQTSHTFTRFHRAILQTAESNLKLLDNCFGQILILPLSLSHFQDSESNFHMKKIAEEIFISLFHNLETCNDFFSACTDIKDISQYLNKDMTTTFIFCQNDDLSKMIEERFYTAKNEAKGLFPPNATDATIFYQLLVGHLLQAIDIFNLSINFTCIPFLRYRVALHYFLLLSESMKLEAPYKKLVSTIRFKSFIASQFFQICDRKQLGTHCLEKILDLAKNNNFYNTILNDLTEKNTNETTFEPESVKSVLKVNLDNFYNLLQ